MSLISNVTLTSFSFSHTISPMYTYSLNDVPNMYLTILSNSRCCLFLVSLFLSVGLQSSHRRSHVSSCVPDLSNLLDVNGFHIDLMVASPPHTHKCTHTHTFRRGTYSPVKFLPKEHPVYLPRSLPKYSSTQTHTHPETLSRGLHWALTGAVTDFVGIGI